MNKSKLLLSLIGAIICFAMFVIGMLYSNQLPLLILVGGIGLAGFSYFTLRIFFNLLGSKISS